jgi:DNA topoisomerase-1
VKHFPRVLDVRFTSRMEDELDEVESGEMDWLAVLRRFYGTFEKSLEKAKKEMTAFEETDETCPLCGKPLVKRLSKGGLYLACKGYPECKYTKNLSTTGGEIEADVEGKNCPLCGKPLVVRSGKRGPFIGCTGYPDCTYTANIETGGDGAKPESAAPLPEMEPRECPECGKPLKVRTGRRGPFIGCTCYPKCRYTEPLPGAEAASAATGDAPSAGEGQAPPAPLPEIPPRDCPRCGKPLKVRTGRRGPFVGCTGYPKCRYTEPLSGPEAAAPAGAEAPAGGKASGEGGEAAGPAAGKTCPNCGRPLVVKRGRRGAFLACPGYPDCKYTEPVKGGARAEKSMAEKVGRECPQCGAELVYRTGSRGEFIGCSAYPKCRYTENV